MSRDLIERLRTGEWWRSVVQGSNPTSFSTDETATAREAADRIAALEAEASEGERRLEVERLVEFNAMLIRDNERYQEAGSALAAAALRVTSEFDGVHRLRLAASAWAKAAADEGGRALIPEAPVREPSHEAR